MEVEYRNAEISDLNAIVAFVDFWLTGGGLADGVSGASHDFFVPYGRHKAYLVKYQVLLAIYGGEIVGWAVKTKKGVLIHLLVAGTFRGNGIGGEMLRRMDPDSVRSKFDQSTGDPSGFYRKQGYVKASGTRLGKRQNIDIFTKPRAKGVGGIAEQAESGERAFEPANDIKGDNTKHRRSVDALAEKLHLGNFHSERF